MDSVRIATDRAPAQPWYQPLPALLPVLIATVCLLSLLLLVQVSGVTTTGYDVRRLEQERDDWYSKNYQIEADIAKLQSLDRVEKEATGRLKMVPATSRIFVQANKLWESNPKPYEAPPSHEKEKTRNTDSTSFLDNLLSTITFWKGSGRN